MASFRIEYCFRYIQYIRLEAVGKEIEKIMETTFKRNKLMSTKERVIQIALGTYQPIGCRSCMTAWDISETIQFTEPDANMDIFIRYVCPKCYRHLSGIALTKDLM